MFCLFFQYFDIRFVLLYDVTLCRRARDLPGLPDMSWCQNNVCNKNQKLKSYHNAVLHTAPESGPDLPAFPAGTGTTDVGPLSPRSDAQWRILP